MFRISGPRVSLVIVAFALVACSEPRTLVPERVDANLLVECPASQESEAVATIGAAGGSVSVGGTSVVIPAGALSGETSIALRIPASRYVEIEVRANDLPTFSFAQPVVVTIDYSRCSSEAVLSAPVTAWHIDPVTKQLLEDMHGVDDKLTHRITFTTTHFSGYAVAN